ncbi:MAG: hypothetical protein ACLQVY_20180 [Limisphaerales bacterium]
MKTNEIRWLSFERGDLPKALFGDAAKGVHAWRMENALETGRGIAVGYAEDEEEVGAYSPPAIIVLDDRGAAETLSWLKTFAPETSPLSQFARVVSHSDWERFGAERPFQPRAGTREDRWGCVVLGELLAQGESGVEVTSLPLSWSASCFSTAVARSAILHPTEDASRISIERLLILEEDSKFARRQVAIASLEPVWASASSRAREVFEVSEVVNVVVNTIVQTANNTTPLQFRPSNLFAPQGDLMSDSVEDRVVAFQKLASQLGDVVGERTPTAVEQAIIAAGAFLVGRGSSHSFLLNRLSRRWSQAFTWFGLMVGLAGPQSWDSEWSRASKGLERLLRARIDWCNTSGADLSWPEYMWLTKTFTGKQVFAELPKMVPKVLSIEILPGVACQLRLAADSGGGTRDVSQRERAEFERRERELRETLDQVATLAMRARLLLPGPEAPRKPSQGAFGLEAPEGRESKTSLSRRGKRS